MLTDYGWRISLLDGPLVCLGFLILHMSWNSVERHMQIEEVRHDTGCLEANRRLWGREQTITFQRNSCLPDTKLRQDVPAVLTSSVPSDPKVPSD